MPISVQRLLVLSIFVILAFALGRWSVSWQERVTSTENTTDLNSTKNKQSIVDKIKAKKELEVVIVNGPTTYFVGATGEEGFEYLLMRDFAEYLGVVLKLHVVSTVTEALQLTKDGVGEITSGALSKTAQREKEFIFGPSYYSVKEQVVCHQNMIKKGTFPRSVEDLVGLKIVVGSETSYSDTLTVLQKELPELNFNLSQEKSSEEILGDVNKGNIDCTVVDSNIFAVNNRYYPALRKAFSITESKKLAWILREDEEELNSLLNGWLNGLNRSDEMAMLIDHYYSYTNTFNYVNIITFHNRLKSRLPKYKKLFVHAAEKYDIPWTLLAAQSYQESHWDRLAKSPTGVRGMMMLTLPTAKEMGVKYRLNAKQSIYGGAKYFANVYNRISPEVTGIDRYKFAYAAYNVGMGHLIDARKLAISLGKDQNSWKDMKSVLPLLSKRKYYKKLRYGYARGQEPVDYVEAIYEYHVILENKFRQEVQSEK